jgi:hypothetical protein
VLKRLRTGPDDLPADITAAYRHALPEALKLLAGTLTAPHDHNTTQYLLAAAAALKGHPTLGGAIDDLGLDTKCPSCGALAPR